MKMRLLLLLFSILFVACSADVDTSVAPEIRHGEDVCERCGMIISDDRYSAAYWTTDGDARLFDDIGGMLDYYQEHGEAVGSFWVHDFASRAFIAAETSYLVLSDMQTPMGFGIAACATEAAAHALAADNDNATVISFNDALTQLASGDLMLDPEHRHNQESHHQMDSSHDN
jgi:copper chaperone NosL